MKQSFTIKNTDEKHCFWAFMLLERLRHLGLVTNDNPPCVANLNSELALQQLIEERFMPDPNRLVVYLCDLLGFDKDNVKEGSDNVLLLEYIINNDDEIMFGTELVSIAKDIHDKKELTQRHIDALNAIEKADPEKCMTKEEENKLGDELRKVFGPIQR